MAAEGHEAALGARHRAEAALATLRRRRADAPRRAFPTASSAPPTPTSCAAARAGRSSPATRGSPTGAATPSSRCAACAWRPAASTRRARSCVEWAGAVSEGMLPNRFPDAASCARVQLRRRVALVRRRRARVPRGAGPPARRVAGATPAAARGRGRRDPRRATRAARATASAPTPTACSRAGEPGVQLTWMDAKVGDWVVTPRIGKPVEVQALWINALRIAGALLGRLARRCSTRALDVVRAALLERGGGCLYDVVDVDHRAGDGRRDAPAEPDLRRRRPARFRSLDGRARAARRRRGRGAARGRRSACARSRPDDPGYAGRYEGGAARARRRLPPGDGLAVAARAPSSRPGCACAAAGATARREARERFLAPLLAHLDEAGLGHVSEIADGEPPHTPRGCPFQAWSVGELLRLDRRGPRRVGLPDRRRRPRAASTRRPGRGIQESATMTDKKPASTPSASASTRTSSARRTGSAGGPTSPSGSGARCARTTARTATPGTTSRTTTPARAPTAGARTASPASPTATSTSASRSRSGTGSDPILKERLFGLTGPRATTARTSRSTTSTSTPRRRTPT